MTSPRYTLEIGGSGRGYISLQIDKFKNAEKIHTWSAKLADIAESVSKQNAVNIKRDGTSIFQGILEDTNSNYSEGGAFLDVSGRHTAVKLWRKWTERYADVGGFWTNYYPNKIIEFLLRPSRSDMPTIDNPYRRVGWGIDSAAWTPLASATADADHEEENVTDRLNTIGWSSGKNQETGDYFQVDLGSSKTICGIRIENRTAGPEEFIRNYKIETSTTGAFGGEKIQVASKSNNRAINIVESWTAAATRYIRITCTGNFADNWRIGEIFIYESAGAISGISVGTITEHLPLNCTLTTEDISIGETAIDVKEGWRFQARDDIIIGDNNGEEINEIVSVSGNTLTVSACSGAYTTAAKAFIMNLDRFTEINLEYMRRSDTIDKIVKLCTTDDLPWEWEVTDAGAVNVGSRIGSNVSGSVEFVYETNIEQASNMDSDKERIDTVLVLGKGKGDAQDLISSGWVGSGNYEQVVVDSTVVTAEGARSKAESIIEQYSGGKQTQGLRVNDTHNSGTWDVGDDITLTCTLTNLSGSYNVSKVTRTYSSAGETVVIDCTNETVSRDDVIANLVKLLNSTRQEGEYLIQIFDAVVGNVGFNLFYEAELLTLDPDATIETDATSHNKAHVKMASAESGIVWWGPGASLKAGTYRIIFKCKVTSNVSSSNLVTLDVYSTTDGTAIGTITIAPSKFTTNDTWQIISYTFTLTKDYNDLEFRANAFQTGLTDFYCDWVGVTTNWIVDNPPGPPAAPTGVNATGKPLTIQVIWTQNTEADLAYYILYRGTASAPTTAYAYLTTNYFVDNGATYGTTYYYRLKAVDWSGNVSGYSAEDSATASQVSNTWVAEIDSDWIAIELKPWTSNLSVIWDDVNDTPPTDFNHIKWGAPGGEGSGGSNATIAFADATTRSITANENAGVSDGFWYIYWTTANTVLQWSTTYSDAVGAGKGLLGIVVINNAASQAPTILLFGSYQPTIGAGVIAAYSIFSKHISSDVIIGKNFSTGSGVGGGGGPAGVTFNANGIIGYSGGAVKSFELESGTGDVIVYGDGTFKIKTAGGTEVGHFGIDDTLGAYFSIIAAANKNFYIYAGDTEIQMPYDGILGLKGTTDIVLYTEDVGGSIIIYTDNILTTADARLIIPYRNDDPTGLINGEIWLRSDL